MSYSRLFYHAIWTTKQRQPLIVDDNETAIYSAIRTKVEELHGILHAINGMPDHVHLVVTIPPTLAIASVIGQLKGCSSYIGARAGGNTYPFAWQQEYGILSISESHLSHVIHYVELQKQHHTENQLDSRLEATQLST